jgi:dCTP deaminase
VDQSESSSSGWLTGTEIREQVSHGRIIISPFDQHLLNPNSYNYRLGPCIRRIKNEVIDLKCEDEYEELEIPEKGLVLIPGECYLGCTVEEFGSDYYAALLTGRSSVGRKFITNHITAGLIDQGFFGKLTLEIVVCRPTRVYPNIVFGQIFWFTVAGRPFLYSGKYQNQHEPTLSKLHFDGFGRT